MGSAISVLIVAIIVLPEELDVDHFLCTHSHYDHADPETIGRVRKQAVQTFVGPGLACESFCNCGVEKAKIQQAYPGGKLQVSDVVVHGTFAMPTDDSDLNHMGFVLAVENGPRIYISGDTDYSDLLAHVRKLEPDIMITCVNGGFNNLEPLGGCRSCRADQTEGGDPLPLRHVSGQCRRSPAVPGLLAP